MTSTPDLQQITLAHRMADSAGDIVRRFYRRTVAIDRKGDNSPVTAADREVETALRDLIENFYPDHGIIGEEFGNIRSQSPYQWVLDPIDGTRSFIAGYPMFTTLIALAHEGMSILGVIDQPISGERWVGVAGNPTLYAIRGNPSFTLGEYPSQRPPDKAVIATTSIDYFTPAQTQKFLALKSKTAGVILGGDAYAYAMLACGQIDIVFDVGMKPYDFCALKPVIEGMGGIITDWQGKAITTSSDGSVLAAANRELHEEALKLL